MRGRMYTENPVFTTGQIATICGIAPRTVARKIDEGKLKSFRLPGGVDRRVQRADLVEWMRAAGMPISRLEEFEAKWRLKSCGLRILLLSPDEALVSALEAAAKKNKPPLHLQAVSSETELGMMLGEISPEVIIVDFDLDTNRARNVCARVKAWDVENRAFLVGLRSNGFVPGVDRVDKTVGKPCEPALLLKSIFVTLPVLNIKQSKLGCRLGRQTCSR